MFTGLIESVGQIAEVQPSTGGRRLRIDATLAAELAPGDSLSVNGVCLTVVPGEGGGVWADVSPETLRLTTLGELKTGSLVNLERSLRADARVGGHFVQGHVDGTGRIRELRQQGDAYWLSIEFPPQLAPYIVHKGSIAVDGISLTVAALDHARLDVQIIPFTFQHTNLRAATPGMAVNLECDILGKYVVRALELNVAARGES